MLIKENFGNLTTFNKASSMAGTKLRGLTERGFAYKELEYSTLLQQSRLLSYEIYVWVHSAIRAIGNQFTKLPFKIYMMDNKGHPDKKAEVTNGRTYNLFKRPNAMMNWYTFMYGAVSNMQLMGNLYLERGGEDPLYPTEIYPWRGDWVEIIPDPVNLVAQYLYRPNGVPIYFSPEQVSHMKFWHSRSELYGLSPLSALRQTITTDMFVQQYQANFFRQGGVAQHYISCPTEIGDEDFESLKQRMRTEYQGVDRSHLLGILDNDMKIESVEDESNKLDLKELRLQLRNEVLGVYHVPLIWVMAEGQTYDNADSQKKVGWENCIQPLAKQFEAFWDSEFLNIEGQCCEYDFSGIHALQENMTEKAQQFSILVKSGIYKPNEARKEYKLEPVEGGDELVMTQTPQTVDAIDAASITKDSRIIPGTSDSRPPTNMRVPIPSTKMDYIANGKVMLNKMKRTLHKLKHGQLTKAEYDRYQKNLEPALNKLKHGVRDVLKNIKLPSEHMTDFGRVTNA